MESGPPLHRHRRRFANNPCHGSSRASISRSRCSSPARSAARWLFSAATRALCCTARFRAMSAAPATAATMATSATAVRYPLQRIHSEERQDQRPDQEHAGVDAAATEGGDEQLARPACVRPLRRGFPLARPREDLIAFDLQLSAARLGMPVRNGDLRTAEAAAGELLAPGPDAGAAVGTAVRRDHEGSVPEKRTRMRASCRPPGRRRTGRLEAGAPSRIRRGQRDSCFPVVADQTPARRTLPIELSSVVTSLVIVTRELTKKLSHDEAVEVISELCEQLRAIPDEKRGPNRPFTR
jgi:hypothetical protein